MLNRRNAVDNRRRDYTPHTAFQKWLKAKLDRGGLTYKDVHIDLARRGFDFTENHVYRIVRGDPEQYPSAARPGYELAYAIGQMFADIKGALDAAGYPNDAPDPFQSIGVPLPASVLDRLLNIPLYHAITDAGPTTLDAPATSVMAFLDKVGPPEMRGILVSDEWKPAPLEAGDILLVLPQPGANNGDLVIARVDESNTVCKRYREGRNGQTLEAENGEDVIAAPRFRIIAVVVYIAHRMRRD